MATLLSRTLAEWAAGLKYEDLTPDAIEGAKRVPLRLARLRLRRRAPPTTAASSRRYVPRRGRAASAPSGSRD